SRRGTCARLRADPASLRRAPPAAAPPRRRTRAAPCRPRDIRGLPCRGVGRAGARRAASVRRDLPQARWGVDRPADAARAAGLALRRGGPVEQGSRRPALPPPPHDRRTSSQRVLEASDHVPLAARAPRARLAGLRLLYRSPRRRWKAYMLGSATGRV